MPSPRPRISALGFFARHLQYALLWVLESLLLYTDESHKKEKAHRFVALTNKPKQNQKQKSKGDEKSQLLVGSNFVQYLFLRKAENPNVLRSREKLKERSAFPTL